MVGSFEKASPHDVHMTREEEKKQQCWLVAATLRLVSDFHQAKRLRCSQDSTNWYRDTIKARVHQDSDKTKFIHQSKMATKQEKVASSFLKLKFPFRKIDIFIFIKVCQPV